MHSALHTRLALLGLLASQTFALPQATTELPPPSTSVYTYFLLDPALVSHYHASIIAADATATTYSLSPSSGKGKSSKAGLGLIADSRDAVLPGAAPIITAGPSLFAQSYTTSATVTATALPNAKADAKDEPVVMPEIGAVRCALSPNSAKCVRTAVIDDAIRVAEKDYDASEVQAGMGVLTVTAGWDKLKRQGQATPTTDSLAGLLPIQTATDADSYFESGTYPTATIRAGGTGGVKPNSGAVLSAREMAATVGMGLFGVAAGMFLMG